MANEWFRLWHDMPNDPKFKTIARHSGQPISLVLSVSLHLMNSASRNVTRGHVDVTVEDLASALDCDETQIEKILTEMQGRLLDGNVLTGWEKRQPRRETSDTAKSDAERKREQRERQKLADQEAAKKQCHDVSRNVTPDKDKDKELKDIGQNAVSTVTCHDGHEKRFTEFWAVYPKKNKKIHAEKKYKKISQSLHEKIILDVTTRKSKHRPWLDGYVPDPTTYLNGQRWTDSIDSADVVSIKPNGRFAGSADNYPDEALIR